MPSPTTPARTSLQATLERSSKVRARRARRRRLGIAVIAAATLGMWPVAWSLAATNTTTTTSPGAFTGWAFDACGAPTASTMDKWMKDKKNPYRGVGVYISGSLRACSQTNLTASWVSHVQQSGWHLLPLTVGPQASCTGFRQVINAAPANTYAAARQQGAAQADDAVTHANALGINPGSTLFYDMESWHTGYNNCDASTLWFLSAWTNRLHAYGYAGGVYSSGSTGIRLLNAMANNTPSGFVIPDHLWVAEWNNKANTASNYVDAQNWAAHQRVHQFQGGHNATNGGVTINIDSNYADLLPVSPIPAVVPDSAIGALPTLSPSPSPSGSPSASASTSPSSSPSSSTVALPVSPSPSKSASASTSSAPTTAPVAIGTNYSVYLAKDGWTPTIHNDTSGAGGAGAQIQAIKLSINAPYSGGITWRAANPSWSRYTSGNQIGTIGKRLEAFQLSLTGALATHYDINYRAVVNGSWQAWKTNGQTAGITGKRTPISQIMIKLTPKPGTPTATAKPSTTTSKTVHASTPIAASPTPTPVKAPVKASPSAKASTPVPTPVVKAVVQTTSARGIQAPVKPAVKALPKKLAQRLPNMESATHYKPAAPSTAPTTAPLNDTATPPQAAGPAAQQAPLQPTIPGQVKATTSSGVLNVIWQHTQEVLAAIGSALAAVGAWIGRGLGSLLGW